MNQRPEADDQLRHELDTMINISAVQDLNYVVPVCAKGSAYGHARKRPLACVSLGESVEVDHHSADRRTRGYRRTFGFANRWSGSSIGLLRRWTPGPLRVIASVGAG